MKPKYSLIILIGIASTFALYRFHSLDQNTRITTWDAFGYYMYLPSSIIYKDVQTLKWVKPIDSTYHLTGGQFYQAIQVDSNHYTNKYLCGVAIMQSPFFLIAHSMAEQLGAKADGFSWPYQYALCIGALIWVMLGFAVLRKTLLSYFDEHTIALCLLMIALCSNLIQYATIDAAQSHVWIFSLYAFILYATQQWHKKPSANLALFIGLLCGLATISRPTEAIIIFIPLLWDMNNPISRKQKWALVFKHKKHLLLALVGGVLGILPQLFYWHYTTGYWVYDVGSKWYFLNPWFRVLLGIEKGWFLYTPISIFMVWGLCKIKGYSFQYSVIIFCLLNIWIIIAWSDWRYGGSYSTRALVQSYPVFALALSAWIHQMIQRSRVIILYSLLILLGLLNAYQLSIYNKGIGENFSPIILLFYPL